MHYQLFVPNVSQQDTPDLETLGRHRGILDVFGGHDVLYRECCDGHSGLLIAWLSPQNSQHCYRPEAQTWLPSIRRGADGVPLYYIGLWNDSPPTPRELRRVYTQEGTRTKLGNHSWLLPTPDTVDSKAVYNDDGTMRWEPVRQFRWLCDEAAEMRDLYLQHKEGLIRQLTYQLEPSAQVEWLMKLLRVNYRFLPELADPLDMFVRKMHIWRVFLSTIGLVPVENEVQTDVE